MSSMIMLEQNILDTTTMITVPTNTAQVDRFFDRDKDRQWNSDGANNDAVGVTMTISFLATETVDKIILENINFKNFAVYYNGNIANKFTLLNAETTTSEWTGNSDTSLYLNFGSLDMTSITIVCTSTIIANEEKKIGQFWSTYELLQLDRNPTSRDYSPLRFRKQTKHEMSDGGIALYNVDIKYRYSIKLNYRSDSITSALETIYERINPFVFIPYPTGTKYYIRPFISEVNWVGNFNFDKPAKNHIESLTSWKGSLNLQETPN